MDPFALTRPKTFKSRIPVHIRRVKPSNLACKESETCEKLPPLSQTSNINRTVENSQRLQKELLKKSKPQVEKASTNKTCKTNKTNKKPSSVSQTSYSNKSTAKSSGRILKDVVKNSNSQIINTRIVKNCKEDKITEKASFGSQTSNAKSKAEHEGKSCFQIEKAAADKNIKNAKYKFTSSKVNTQTAEKINKNEKLLTPKIIIEKENKKTSDINCFSAQKDLKFEANELFRKMILSGKELSPSICKIMPGLKLSSVQTQRPSAYQKFEVHPNPYQEALQAIATASARRKNRKFSTENCERAKIITAQSPFKERNSFYTPCADPKGEVMKSLEALKARQRVQKSALKSSKKVTFNLNVEEYTAKIDCDSEPIPSNSCESRLTQINEGSKENTPSSPVRNRSETSDVNQESNKQESNVQIKSIALTGNIEEHIHPPITESSEMCTVPTTSLRDVETKNLSIECVEPSFYCSKKTDAVTSDFVCDSVKFAQETLSCQRTTGILLERNATDLKLEKTSQAKLYTPRPISFFSNSRFLKNSPSPELLNEKTLLPSLAPIYTPLALKSMAKSSAVSPDAGFSPVRLKLDFTEEKDTPIKISSVKKNSSDTLKKIFTVQRRLDDLADQECSFWLLNESIPVVCGRYLQNPVAVTLNEGDEMHFLPIRL